MKECQYRLKRIIKEFEVCHDALVAIGDETFSLNEFVDVPLTLFSLCEQHFFESHSVDDLHKVFCCADNEFNLYSILLSCAL